MAPRSGGGPVSRRMRAAGEANRPWRRRSCGRARAGMALAARRCGRTSWPTWRGPVRSRAGRARLSLPRWRGPGGRSPCAARAPRTVLDGPARSPGSRCERSGTRTPPACTRRGGEGERSGRGRRLGALRRRHRATRRRCRGARPAPRREGGGIRQRALLASVLEAQGHRREGYGRDGATFPTDHPSGPKDRRRQDRSSSRRQGGVSRGADGTSRRRATCRRRPSRRGRRGPARCHRARPPSGTARELRG
jgi:hypothetical protein